MRMRIVGPLLLGLALTACGAPDTSSQTAVDTIDLIAATSVAAASSAPTATTLPTFVPATPTSAPTNTPEPTLVPTPEPTPPIVTPAEPVRLQIPAINLDYKPVGVGLDQNRVPIVLDHDVAWYNLSAMPGQGNNVVFWGHVLRFKAKPNIPAPFARVEELNPGDEIIVTTALGEEARYRVTQEVRVKPDQVQYILPTGKEQLTLVSCIGDKVISNGFVTKTERLVTIAEPVQ